MAELMEMNVTKERVQGQQSLGRHPYPPQKGKRRATTRSKTGCITCKIRRVKCDETKPGCNRCTASGFRCDGYVPPSESPQPAAAPKILPRPGRVAIAFAPSGAVQKSSQDNRTFDFFRSQTIPMLSGYFDADFWKRIILQIGHAEPAVWHSALALSALHEGFFIEGQELERIDQVKQRQYALQHYNEAISRLTRQLSQSQESTNVVLASCILFVCLENLLGNVAGAIKHIHGGISIIRSQEARSQNNQLVDEAFAPMLNHFNQHTFIYGHLAPPAPASKKPFPNFDLCGQCKDFSSLHDANTALQILQNDGQQIATQFRLTPRNIQDAEWNRARLLELHSVKIQVPQWSIAFDTLLRKPSMINPTPDDKQAIAFLRIQHRLVSIWVANAGATTETSFDVYVRDYAGMANLAETTLEYGQQNGQAGYSFQVQNIASLFLTAHKCRNPMVRRRALTLLRRFPKRGGFWDSRLVVFLVEKIIEFEEEGIMDTKDSTGSLVPDEWARIVALIVNPELDDMGGVVISFHRRPHGRMNDWVVKEDYFPTLPLNEIQLFSKCPGNNSSDCQSSTYSPLNQLMELRRCLGITELHHY